MVSSSYYRNTKNNPHYVGKFTFQQSEVNELLLLDSPFDKEKRFVEICKIKKVVYSCNVMSLETYLFSTVCSASFSAFLIFI